MSSLFDNPLAIIDTETTGMRPGFARVVDVGIIRVEHGKVVEQYETLLNPETSIPPSVSAIHGIYDHHIARAPTFDEVALEIERILDGAIFVAHNAAFDYGFMKAEFARLGMTFSAPTLCTVRLSRALFPCGRHNLDSVIERHKLACANRHRAFPDAEVVWHFLQTIDTSVEAEALERAVAAVMKGDVRAIAKDSFRSVPDTSGIYRMYGPEHELLYVGKAKHLRARTRAHFTGTGQAADRWLGRETSFIETIPTSGELSALLLESALIKREMPLYNRQLRRKRVLYIAKRYAHDDGFDTVAIERAENIATDGSTLSVFRSAAQAKSVIRTLARQYGLCERLLGIEPGKGPCFKSQLGDCAACAGSESPALYNARLSEAFATRSVSVWPYKRPIIIRERESDSKGTAFFLDQWILHGAYRYDDEQFEPLIEPQAAFDYDTYKIVSRFLRKPPSACDITTVAPHEFCAQLSRIRGEDA